jgi:hypothetical protein
MTCARVGQSRQSNPRLQGSAEQVRCSLPSSRHSSASLEPQRWVARRRTLGRWCLRREARLFLTSRIYFDTPYKNHFPYVFLGDCIWYRILRRIAGLVFGFYDGTTVAQNVSSASFDGMIVRTRSRLSSGLMLRSVQSYDK